MSREKVDRSEIIRFDAAVRKIVKEYSEEELVNFILDNLPYQKLQLAMSRVERAEQRESDEV